jgi:hypothetical protein
VEIVVSLHNFVFRAEPNYKPASSTTHSGVGKPFRSKAILPYWPANFNPRYTRCLKNIIKDLSKRLPLSHFSIVGELQLDPLPLGHHPRALLQPRDSPPNRDTTNGGHGCDECRVIVGHMDSSRLVDTDQYT